MTYKSCHYCFTFYCSRHCRQEHWLKHKEKCIYAKAVSVAKQVLRTIYNDHVALDGLSKIGNGFEKNTEICEKQVFLLAQHYRQSFPIHELKI